MSHLIKRSLVTQSVYWSGYRLDVRKLPLEHEASMKLSVSLQFLNLGQSVGLLGRVISSSQDLYQHRTIQTKINVHIHINIHASSRIEPTIPASKRAKTVHALNHSATVTGDFRRGHIFFRPPPNPDQLWGPLNNLFYGHLGVPSPKESARGLTLTIHLHLIQKVEKDW
jgi:hypothetical protein